MKAGKVWGSTEKVFDNGAVSIHRITIKKGAKCSKHKHKHKFNMFYVEQGFLKIHVWKNDYELIDTTKLQAYQRMSVAPGEFHKFEATSDVIAYEIYYTEKDEGDIIREGVGSVE